MGQSKFALLAALIANAPPASQAISWIAPKDSVDLAPQAV